MVTVKIHNNSNQAAAALYRPRAGVAAGPRAAGGPAAAPGPGQGLGGSAAWAAQPPGLAHWH